MKNSTQQRFSIQENKLVDWFEPLYAGSNKAGDAKAALVVGCGMGDDAIELERLGFVVIAFDVSHTAIKLCKERFP